MKKPNRPLTHDEKKAAEAAFQGAPFDPQLSESARRVFIGIYSAIAKKRNGTFQECTLSPSAPMTQKASTELQARHRTKSLFS